MTTETPTGAMLKAMPRGTAEWEAALALETLSRCGYALVPKDRLDAVSAERDHHAKQASDLFLMVVRLQNERDRYRAHADRGWRAAVAEQRVAQTLRDALERLTEKAVKPDRCYICFCASREGKGPYDKSVHDRECPVLAARAALAGASPSPEHTDPAVLRDHDATPEEVDAFFDAISPAPAPRDLAALADEWDALANSSSDIFLVMGPRNTLTRCARELRAALGGADPQLPGKPLPSGMDYRPPGEIPGAELSDEGKAEVARKAASVHAARVRAGEGGDKTFGGADPQPTEPEPESCETSTNSAAWCATHDCLVFRCRTRPASDPDTTLCGAVNEDGHQCGLSAGHESAWHRTVRPGVNVAWPASDPDTQEAER